ncbi:MAG TPA: glycosyltransferase [Thermomicrobiales bacterium]|nr:glycosyltransferase [Thermomicrobiales bacterium]
MAAVDVLIPTCNRRESLLLTLAGVAGQTLGDLRVIVADQSAEPAVRSPVVQAARRVIEARGGAVEWHERSARHGVAEQRDFLLRQATADAVLCLDDDIYLEPWVIERLLATLRAEGCGFVGAFPAGLTYRDDVRPDQQQTAYWDGPVRPEALDLDSHDAWERAQLHRAANLYHVAQALPPGARRRYKVAWLGACVLYDRAKLLAVGGFAFWSRLPRYHSGEDVLVQNLLMRRWGGCGIVPAGAYFAEVPTTVLNAAGTVDGHALALLPEMIARYAPEPAGAR